MDGEGCLTRRLGAEYFDYTATGVSADAESGVEADGAGGDYFDVLDDVVAEFHDCAEAVGLVYLSQGLSEGFFACVAWGGAFFGFLCFWLPYCGCSLNFVWLMMQS